MLRICDYPDCTTLTLGAFCVTHEPPVPAERFPRGRPYPRRPAVRLLEPSVAIDTELAERTQVRAVSLGGGT
jgi:hypothetical protein